MIRFSALLVALAIGLLAAGVAASSLPLVYVSIAVCAVAALLLAAGVLRHWSEIFGPRAQRVASPFAASGPVPSPATAGRAAAARRAGPRARPATAGRARPVGAPGLAGFRAGAGAGPAAQRPEPAVAAGRYRAAADPDGRADRVPADPAARAASAARGSAARTRRTVPPAPTGGPGARAGQPGARPSPARASARPGRAHPRRRPPTTCGTGSTRNWSRPASATRAGCPGPPATSRSRPGCRCRPSRRSRRRSPGPARQVAGTYGSLPLAGSRPARRRAAGRSHRPRTGQRRIGPDSDREQPIPRPAARDTGAVAEAAAQRDRRHQ